MKCYVNVSVPGCRYPAQSSTKVIGKAGRMGPSVDAIHPALAWRMLDACGWVVGVDKRMGRRTVTLTAQVDRGK